MPRKRLKYRYTLLFGYEVGDAVLDNTAKLEHLFRRLVDRIGDARVSVKILCFPSSGSTTAIWNGLFGAAGEEVGEREALHPLLGTGTGRKRRVGR